MNPVINIDADSPLPGFTMPNRAAVENGLLKRELSKRSNDLRELCELILLDDDLAKIHETAANLLWYMSRSPR